MDLLLATYALKHRCSKLLVNVIAFLAFTLMDLSSLLNQLCVRAVILCWGPLRPIGCTIGLPARKRVHQW